MGHPEPGEKPVDLRILREKQELNNGFGNALARAFELVATPMLFGLLGYGLDHLFDTKPILTLVLFLFALAGVVVRMYYGYDQEMRRHEAEGSWAKRS